MQGMTVNHKLLSALPFSALTSLHSLAIQRVVLLGSGLRFLSGLPSLKTLELADTTIYCHGLVGLLPASAASALRGVPAPGLQQLPLTRCGAIQRFPC